MVFWMDDSGAFYRRGCNNCLRSFCWGMSLWMLFLGNHQTLRGGSPICKCVKKPTCDLWLKRFGFTFVLATSLFAVLMTFQFHPISDTCVLVHLKVTKLSMKKQCLLLSKVIPTNPHAKLNIAPEKIPFPKGR